MTITKDHNRFTLGITLWAERYLAATGSTTTNHRAYFYKWEFILSILWWRIRWTK